MRGEKINKAIYWAREQMANYSEAEEWTRGHRDETESAKLRDKVEHLKTLISCAELEQGPELPQAAVKAWKKPLVIKAWQEGLTTRACARIFDISPETVSQWTQNQQRNQKFGGK